ncbi:MAG: peptide deformylase [Nitrospiraceae bacterium]|nr:MAG: peptide deformylase [Nitrospiraceae bacterium]
MGIREIKKYPEKVLRGKTQPVCDFDADLQKLIDDMIETMYDAPGIGLAANQVGVSRQVTVIDISSREEKSSLIVLINPEIVSAQGEISSDEGCLSIPEYTTMVTRADRVKVKAFDREGKSFEIDAEGLLARALQHEIDHLNGVLLIDRIGRIKREFFRKRYSREHELSRK